MNMKNKTSAKTCNRRCVLATAALAAFALFVPGGARAAGPIKLSVSAIGRPPIISNTFVDVAQTLGYFKDAGLDVNMRWFQRGDDTARALLTGDVAVASTASPVGINLIAQGAPVVAIAGMPRQDWIVASDDPTVSDCADLKGKTVAADGINNARYLYMGAVAATCGLKLSQIQMINLANQDLVKAGIAGQVHNGVFHVDELAQVEFKTGKQWHQIKVPAAITTGLHYVMIMTTKQEIANNREALVRFLEVWIRTQKFMSSTAPADRAKFATIVAKATLSDPKVAAAAIKDEQAIGFWVNNNGLYKTQVMGEVDQLVKIGTIKEANRPSYDRIVDTSLYAEAMKRLGSK
jgi:NitT/TauT family transport system substrate-binding protein